MSTSRSQLPFFPGSAVIEKYEKTIQESEERFRKLSEATTEGIIIHDGGKIIEANAAISKILGYEEGELIGKNAIDVIVDEQSKELVKNNIRSRHEGTIETWNIKKDGTKIYCEVSAKEISYKGNSLRIVAFKDISIRKKYEAALKESEEKYRMLIESASDAIFVLDEEGNFIQTNTNGYLMLGYSKEECLTMNITDVIPREELIEQPLKLKEIIQGKTFFSERSLRCSDGRIIYVEASVTRLPDGNMQAILRDISERKKAAKALLQSQENYKNLIEYSPYGIVIHDEKGEVFFANPTALKIMGIGSLKELSSTHVFNYVLPEYHDKIRKRKELMEKGESIEFMRIKIKKADGTIFEGESKAIEITFEGKKSTLVVYHDISYQRQLEKEQLRAQIAEEANKRLQAEIKERKRVEGEIERGKKYVTSLIDSSLDIICAVDKEGLVTEFNKAAQRIFGYTREEIVGKHVNILYKNQEERTLANKSLQKNGTYTAEIVNRKKNGEEFVSYLSASVLKDDTGEIIGAMGVSRDITETKEVEEKIKQSLREKEVLLKEVHHRVKNNLQVISSILNLQSSYITDKKTIDLLRESQNRIKSMSFIHESLYQTKDFSNINFSEYVVNLTSNLLHSYSSGNNIKLKLDVGNVFLNLDLAIPCGLIINELVSNAIKHAFPENKAGEVSITIKQSGDFIKLNIGDNGQGVPKNVDYRNTESLGLQLVMTLVDQLEGDITLDNSKGTQYEIVFKNR